LLTDQGKNPRDHWQSQWHTIQNTSVDNALVLQGERCPPYYFFALHERHGNLWRITWVDSPADDQSETAFTISNSEELNA
jgi:hypothetical protein